MFNRLVNRIVVIFQLLQHDDIYDNPFQHREVKPFLIELFYLIATKSSGLPLIISGL
jgi:hypothetical protein